MQGKYGKGLEGRKGFGGGLAPSKRRWGDLSPEREESPDRTGHPAAESAGRGNLTEAVTEKNRRHTSVGGFGRIPRAGKGENAG